MPILRTLKIRIIPTRGSVKARPISFCCLVCSPYGPTALTLKSGHGTRRELYGRQTVCFYHPPMLAMTHWLSRSAARARSKDTTGRAHKSFFGRQRLEILSNGLSGVSRRTSRGHGPQASAADIGLAHAPRHAEPEEHVSYTTLTNVSVPPRTPHAESRRSAAGSCSETRGRRSKVIEALDENDRRCLGSCSVGFRINTVSFSSALSRRLALDRILSIPDLAGLSSRSIKNVIPPRNTVKRRRSPQHSPRSQGERGKRQAGLCPSVIDFY